MGIEAQAKGTCSIQKQSTAYVIHNVINPLIRLRYVTILNSMLPASVVDF